MATTETPLLESGYAEPLPSPDDEFDDEKRMTIVEHLEELRDRLKWAILAVLVTTIISFVFWRNLMEVLLAPARAAKPDLPVIALDFTETIVNAMKVSIFAGIALAMPVLIYHFVMYFAPALTRREKRYFFRLLPFVLVSFIAGVVFGYFVLIPPAVQFLILFGGDAVTLYLRVSSLVDFMTRFLMAIGLAFEMPLVMYTLSLLGVVSAAQLAKARRFVVVGAFLTAAIITPTPDPLNQTLVAVPLMVLYEIGVLLARTTARSRQQAAPSPPEPPAT